eukprot:g2999.t1 g2999   contig12:1233734-1234944(+)
MALHLRQAIAPQLCRSLLLRPTISISSNSHHVSSSSAATTTTTTCRQLTIQSSSAKSPIIDLRSDTLTQPTPSMLQAATLAPTGDDVLGEDPTINALEAYAADLFGKNAALFVPTGTMSNLCAIFAHCHYNKSAEIIIGKKSHINLYEGGGYANVAGVSAKQIDEDEDAMFRFDDVRDAFHVDDDDHYAKSTLICLENTHNMLGGVALSSDYIDAVGLGAPMGSILVGDTEFIRLARRARKRLGGGMRQAGVMAAMGMHALLNHVERLNEDHARAQRLARDLGEAGFWLPRDGKVDTNVVFFGLPEDCTLTKEELPPLLLQQYRVKIAGGYSSGGKLFRLVTHMDVDDGGIDTTVEGIISLCKR